MSSRPQPSLATALYWIVMAAIAHLHVLLFLVIFFFHRTLVFGRETWHVYWGTMAIAMPAALCLTCQAAIRWREYRGRFSNPRLHRTRYSAFMSLVVAATFGAVVYAFGSHDVRMLLVAFVLGASFIGLRYGTGRAAQKSSR